MIRKKHHSNLPSTPGKSRLSTACPQDRDTIVAAVLDQLAAAPDRLAKFLDETGFPVAGLRAGAENGTLGRALLHHLLTDETLLVSVADALGRSPESVAAAAAQS